MGPNVGLDVSDKGSIVQQTNAETCGRPAEPRPHLHTPNHTCTPQPHLHTPTIYVTARLCITFQVQRQPYKYQSTGFPNKLFNTFTVCFSTAMYRGAEKSLARPGRKQTRKHVRDARDFNNIETRPAIRFSFLSRQGAEGNSRHSDRNIGFFPSWSG